MVFSWIAGIEHQRVIEHVICYAEKEGVKHETGRPEVPKTA
jgi:hypothetical protein